MNPLLRMVVSTSLSGAELVLTTALDGVRKINEALAPAAPRPPVAVPAKDPDVRGAGWRAPELGDLDAASAMLRGRATTGTSTPPTATSQATTAASPAPSRTRPPRARIAKQAASDRAKPAAPAAAKATASQRPSASKATAKAAKTPAKRPARKATKNAVKKSTS